MTLHRIGSEGLLPDRTLVLKLDTSEASSRAESRDGGKADRFALQNSEYHQRVADSFEYMALKEPGRFRLVSASGNSNDVTARLVAAVDDLL